MSGAEERLRAELARAALAVVPAPDPWGRLLDRQRRRWRGRLVGLGAVVAALAITGAVVVPAGGPVPPMPPPDGPVTGQMPYAYQEITSQWTRRLLAGPTRGNLAGDTNLVAELAAELDAVGHRWGIDPALDQVKVLLLADVAGLRVYSAAFHNDTDAVLVQGDGRPGASAERLAAEPGSLSGLKPFSFVYHDVRPTGEPNHSYLTAMAPAGCQIATSREARIGPDGRITRVWVEEGDHIVREAEWSASWWRFTCDGVVRHAMPDNNLGTPVTLAGTPAAEALAASAWRDPIGLTTTGHRVLWSGTAPGGTEPVVVIAGDAIAGVVINAVTRPAELTGPAAVVPGGPFERSGEWMTVPGQAPVTTAVAASDKLVAVRLPTAEPKVVLSNRVLVIAPRAAVELKVTGTAPQTVRLVDGVGVVSGPVPADLTIRAVDNQGRTLAELRFTEPDADGLLFGEPLLQRW